MILLQKIIFSILAAISVVGVIGIPMGDPQFLTNAYILEACFISLAGVALWRIRYGLIPNMIIAVAVIVGNTASPRHMEIMSSFVPFDNALVLIIGGYVLQSALLITSAIALKNRKQLAIKKGDS